MVNENVQRVASQLDLGELVLMEHIGTVVVCGGDCMYVVQMYVPCVCACSWCALTVMCVCV